MSISKPWWAALAVALAAVFVLAFGIRVIHHFSAPHALQPGDRLVPLALTSLEGSPVTVTPSGKAEFINVFATWCSPCRMETPDIVHLAKVLSARGVQFVGIDQQESGAQVQRFRDEFGVRYPVYIDETNLTHVVLGARMIPETVFVDADGVIRWMHEGPLDAADVEAIAQTWKGSE